MTATNRSVGADDVLADLSRARQTAANDDYSKTGTLERTRHVQRMKAMDDAEEYIRASQAREKALREALQGLSDMYAFAWDLVDGGLMMMAETGVPKFEEAHAVACKALGIVLLGDEEDAALTTGADNG